MQAVWNNTIIVEAPKEDLIYIEGNWYFPPESIKQQYLLPSPTPYTCPWKGKCQYFNVGVTGNLSSDNAWSYPNPIPKSLEIVKKDYTDYVAFWRDVAVKE